MTYHDRAHDPQPPEGLREDRGLSFRRPQPVARTLAVAVARAVEGDDPVVFGDAADTPLAA
jgi:hypothetical protein